MRAQPSGTSLAHHPGKALGPLSHGFGGLGEHPEHGDALKRAGGVEVEPKRRLEGGEGHLVQAQRAGEGGFS